MKMKHKKIAVIVWTTDPEANKRFLLRHNKPFNGYQDEWTIVFGDIESNETFEDAAKREVFEEFGIREIKEIKNLNYKIEFEEKHESTEVHFVSIKVEDINSKIILNEESIGYDWMVLDKVKKIMRHEDEKQAFDLII